MTILPIQTDRNQNGKYSGSLHTQSATPEWPSRMENESDEEKNNQWKSDSEIDVMRRTW